MQIRTPNIYIYKCVGVILCLTDMFSICQRCKLNKQPSGFSVYFARRLANDHWYAEWNLFSHLWALLTVKMQEKKFKRSNMHINLFIDNDTLIADMQCLIFQAYCSGLPCAECEKCEVSLFLSFWAFWWRPSFSAVRSQQGSLRCPCYLQGLNRMTPSPISGDSVDFVLTVFLLFLFVVYRV